VNKATLLVILALALALTGIAAADELDDRWYVAPSLGMLVTDDARGANGQTHPSFGLGLGKAISPRVNLELGAHYEPVDLQPGGDYQLTTFGLDLLCFFQRNPGFSPYLVLGAGGMVTDVLEERDHVGFMANTGFGFLTDASDRVGFTFDVRYRFDDNAAAVFDQSAFGDWRVSLGMQVKLGAKPAPTAPIAPAKPAPVDSDGDGVTDDRDRCPGTPAGAKVDANGCELDSDGDGVVDRLDQCPGTPAGARVDAKGCELDSDGDGVVDRLDRCPGTPAGAKVDANGCELDSDGDGVVDRLDKCPGTPKGDKVDAKGCTLLEVTVLKGVNFDNDKATLRPEASAILDESVAILKKYPDLKVEVAGHTDSNASDAYNLKLSQRRADAVRDYFVSKGVDPARLTTKGYGESKPIADNTTAEGRFENRRVELRILN